MTKNDDFSELTNAERNLLIVLTDAENITLRVKEICKECDISYRTYERAWKKEAFINAVHQSWTMLLKQHSIQVINKIVKEAKKGDTKCMSMVLDCIGARKAQKIEHKVKRTHRFADLSDEELDKLMKKYQKEELGRDGGKNGKGI